MVDLQMAYFNVVDGQLIHYSNSHLLIHFFVRLAKEEMRDIG